MRAGQRVSEAWPCAMRRKTDWRYGARTGVDKARRRQAVASPRRHAEVRPRRDLKSRLARPIRPSRVVFDGPHVVDDLPEVIPVAQRELDVIETYLGALLDDALGRTE
jgi:hypothetical protein